MSPCKAQLIDLNQQVDAFRRQGLNIAALTYDSVAVLRHFAERKAIR
jgi:peroxiredoxin